MFQATLIIFAALFFSVCSIMFFSSETTAVSNETVQTAKTTTTLETIEQETELPSVTLHSAASPHFLPDIAEEPQSEPLSPLTDVEERQILSGISSLAVQEGHETELVSYSVSDIFFSDESWAGYVIEFTTEHENGYAIFFSQDIGFKLIELKFGAFSPYYGKPGTYIYPSLGYYIIKANNQYYNAESMILSEDYTPTETPIFYAANSIGGDKNVPVTRSLAFKNCALGEKEISNFYFNYSTSLTSQTHANVCANAAGLIMLNYWNKKFNNNLLKLSTPDINNAGNIAGDARIEYMNLFYDYMNTNGWLLDESAQIGGTHPDDCYAGFERLIREKGYGIIYYKNLNYDEMMSHLQLRRPIFITSTLYNFTEKNITLPIPSSQPLTIEYSRTSGLANAHTFVGYGYAYYILDQYDGSVHREELIKIADGWGGTRYFNYTISGVMSCAAVYVTNR